MRFTIITLSLLAATISFALVEGCSGAAVQPSAMTQLSTAPHQARNAAKAYVYTCQPFYTMSGKGDCDVYDTSGNLLAQLTPQDGLSYPWGTTLFGGNWYVANSGLEDVRVYTQGTSPKLVNTLIDPGFYPIDVAVYGDRGKVKLVAVANNGSPDSGTGGAVVYKGNALNPSYSLPVPSGIIVGIGIGFDSKGDCAFAFGYGGHSHERPVNHVLLYKHCAGNYTDLGITDLGFPGGVIFDQNDNLIVVDQKHGIRICAGTSNCNVAIAQRDFFDLALSSAGTDLWITRYNTGEIFDYAYPALTLKFKFRPANGKSEPTAGVAAN